MSVTVSPDITVRELMGMFNATNELYDDKLRAQTFEIAGYDLSVTIGRPSDYYEEDYE